MLYGALDIGGTKTIAALIDEDGRIAAQERFPSHTQNSLQHLELCIEAMERLLDAAGISPATLPGIGVTLPGIVDVREGVLIRAPFARWENLPVAAILSEKLGTAHIVCENDVNACALGELRFGLGRKYIDFVWMTVSTGVGGDCVSDGKLIRGARGFAGELGHLKVEYEHPALCPCGQRGCLEAHGSGTALNRLISCQAEQDGAFAAAFAEKNMPVNAVSCAQLAKAGHLTAQLMFDRNGMYLGRGMAYCINILNPQAVIVGGGVAASLDLMMDSIRREIRANVFSSMQDVEVLATPLGYEAALLGAAALVIDQKRSNYGTN